MDLNCHKDFGKCLLFSFKLLSTFLFTYFSLRYLFPISMFKQSKLDLKAFIYTEIKVNLLSMQSEGNWLVALLSKELWLVPVKLEWRVVVTDASVL